MKYKIGEEVLLKSDDYKGLLPTGVIRSFEGSGYLVDAICIHGYTQESQKQILFFSEYELEPCLEFKMQKVLTFL